MIIETPPLAPPGPPAPAVVSLETRIAHAARRLAIDMVQRANSGHPGLALGAADILTALWLRHLRHNPADPRWPDRDRFILSAGHGSPLLYALLHLSGYPLDLDDLRQFRQLGSRTPGHPERAPHLGIEMTTGPLGQGLGAAVGLALAERWLAARFNRPGFPVVDHYTYALVSDGDLMEGISHEAASLAGHLGLERLIVLYDDNHISIDGPTDLSFSEDVGRRFEAYGWRVWRIDGHAPAALDQALAAARISGEQPCLIQCRTHIGYGSPRQDRARAHGEPLGAELVRDTRRSLGRGLDWPEETDFYIPPEILEPLAAMRLQGARRQAEWEALFARYREEHPALAARWERLAAPAALNWETVLPDFTDAAPLATRAASGKTLDSLSLHHPLLVGGSADLSESNRTLPRGAQAVRPGDYTGSYLHYGVREHAMGAVMNGLALHGLRPYGGTFLVFSDYLRPAIRLAALMELPVVYVFTHDSIGVGEDGPTHQPVEHLLALRAIPGLVVLRPADGNETARAWQVALERRNGPTALVLTRQALPQVTARTNDLPCGAYVLADPPAGVAPQVALLASGSEVHLALQAQAALAQSGTPARVVSMPSWELFDAQPDAYRRAVLPPGLPCLAVEAASGLAWARYTGDPAATLTMDGYGASGPAGALFTHFGFQVDHLVTRARALARQT